MLTIAISYDYRLMVRRLFEALVAKFTSYQNDRHQDGLSLHLCCQSIRRFVVRTSVDPFSGHRPRRFIPPTENIDDAPGFGVRSGCSFSSADFVRSLQTLLHSLNTAWSIDMQVNTLNAVNGEDRHPRSQPVLQQPERSFCDFSHACRDIPFNFSPFLIL